MGVAMHAATQAEYINLHHDPFISHNTVKSVILSMQSVHMQDDRAWHSIDQLFWQNVAM